MTLTVLYDAGCPICRKAIGWLASQPQRVPLEPVAIGSSEHHRRAGWLAPAEALRQVTVLSETGAVYRGDAAWITCLWALAGYRGLANSLSRPALRPFARAAVTTVARLRTRDGATPWEGCADDACGRPS